MKIKSKKVIKKLHSPLFYRFFIVGFSAFLLDTAVLNIVKFIFLEGEDLDIINIISFPKLLAATSGTIFGFYMQRKWTFKVKDNQTKQQAFRYFLVMVINIIIASVIYRIYYQILKELPIVENYDSLQPTFANIITTGTIMFISFFFYKTFVFNGSNKSKSITSESDSFSGSRELS